MKTSYVGREIRHPVLPGGAQATRPSWVQLSSNLFRWTDTCHVYAIRSGDQAVLVDFGDGSILDCLETLGVKRVTDILMTHHHRDQAQGLYRAREAGTRVWVPHTEQELFAEVDVHWQRREIANNYNVRQDRFSLLEPVPISGTLHDYGAYRFGDHTYQVIPTPGHTPGSLSLQTEIDGLHVAFTGDLIAAPGKVWSLAATQWTYNGAEGVAANILSLLDIKERGLDRLLPSHGQPIEDPNPAIDLLVSRLWQVLEYREQNLRLFDLYRQPYVALSAHLLMNQTSLANSYVLLSESGKALVVDYGYDFMTGFAAGPDRASRRPWLYTLAALKRDHGVRLIDVAIPTHFHDDHVAGLNLLRQVEGTRVWAPENFVDILEKPTRYDLPCLWFDPIKVDRSLPLNQPVEWEEYRLILHPLPGHTRYAAAIEFEVDGLRVLATGDQYQDRGGYRWNYVYQNRFQFEDYRLSAALYRRFQPDLILSGHWGPLWVQPQYLDLLEQRGETLERLHRELLPAEILGFGAEGFGARLQPYQVVAEGGERVAFDLEVQNPSPWAAGAIARIVAPAGWEVEQKEIPLSLPAYGVRAARFYVTPPFDVQVRRARLAVDLTVGSQKFGQQAEALVTVRAKKLEI